MNKAMIAPTNDMFDVPARKAWKALTVPASIKQ
jgi:hypothetical protein